MTDDDRDDFILPLDQYRKQKQRPEAEAVEAEPEKAKPKAEPKEETEEERSARLEAIRGLTYEWVWVSTLGRYMKRADPSIALKKDAFNDKFRYLARGGSLTNLLHARRDRTIVKPDRVVYRPNQDEFLRGDRVLEWNLWRPSEIVAREGDTTLWDAHLSYLWPDQQRDLLLNWLAGVLQRLEVKPMHALLPIGEMPGTGKSWVLRVLAKLIGDSNWTPITQDVLRSGFTGWALHTKLVIVEELRNVGNAELANKLHPWITQPEMMVNEKNLPMFTIEQVIAFAMMSNRLNAIKLDISDRRYLVVKTEAEPHPGGIPYYIRLYDLLKDKAALGAILHQLMGRDLRGYNICGRAPETAAKEEMRKATASDLAHWIAENSGEVPYSYQAVTMEEIGEAVPRYIMGNRSTGFIREALEESGYYRFPQQIRLGGRKADRKRVWLHPSVEGREALAPVQVRQIYVAERPGKYDQTSGLHVVTED
jgi:hypothetical protein